MQRQTFNQERNIIVLHLITIPNLIYIIFLLILPTQVGAQEYPKPAYQVAKAMVDPEWEKVQKILNPAVAELEKGLASSGVSGNVSKIWSEEFAKNLTRENLTLVVSEMLEKELESDDLKTLADFFYSPLGIKYRAFVSKISNDQEFLRNAFIPILKKSCTSARERLGFFEKRDLDKICSLF